MSTDNLTNTTHSFRFDALAGRTVVVTGTTRGIGKALLPGLLEQGLNLILLNRRMDVMEDIRRELEVDNDRMRLLHCDLAEPESVRSAAAEIIAAGWPVDAIVNNAAIDPRHYFDGKTDPWAEVFQVNFSAAVALTRLLLPQIRRSPQGRIVFMGSVLADLGGACLTAYSSTKGAIAGLTRALAHELKGTGITVNCIVPGAVAVEKENNPTAIEKQLIEWQSVARRLVPDDVLGILCLLLSNYGSAITAQMITVDGGIVHPIADPGFQSRNLGPRE